MLEVITRRSTNMSVSILQLVHGLKPALWVRSLIVFLYIVFVLEKRELELDVFYGQVTVLNTSHLRFFAVQNGRVVHKEEPNASCGRNE